MLEASVIRACEENKIWSLPFSLVLFGGVVDLLVFSLTAGKLLN